MTRSRLQPWRRDGRSRGSARGRFPALALAALAGALIAWLLDPQSGKRRRALLGDKLGHYRRVAPRRMRRAAHAVPGTARGALHDLRHRLPGYQSTEPPDEAAFIKQRVESELGRERQLWVPQTTFEAVDGIVRIRGTVPDEQTAQKLVQRVARVPGVRAVESRMKLPGEEPVMLVAGDRELVSGPSRAVVLGARVREQIVERWPGLTDQIISDSDGHLGRLVTLIEQHSGQPEADIRASLDQILLAAVYSA